MDSVFSGNWGKDAPSQSITSYLLVDEETFDTEVWKKLTINLVSKLKQEACPVEAKWTEDPIIGFELEKAFAEAVETLPNPKAWQKLEKK